MSFNCYNHGWSHLLNPCPFCHPVQTYTSSTSDFKMTSDKKRAAIKAVFDRLHAMPDEDFYKLLDERGKEYGMTSEKGEPRVWKFFEGDVIEDDFEFVEKEHFDALKENVSDLKLELRMLTANAENLKQANERLRLALDKILKTEGLMFAESSDAEEILKIVREALKG